MGYTVGQVAVLAGITVRTLHHYDEISLVSPSGRTPAGYRTYSEPDLDRLRQVLFYRRMGLPLAEIAGLLDDPGRDALSRLRGQHAALTRRIAQLQHMLAALEKEMEASQMGIELTPQERFELYGRFDPGEYEQEAEQRWGETDAYRESRRRTTSYSKEDWAAIKAETNAIESDFAAAFQAGSAADSAAARAVAERHQSHISRWFYDCGHQAHRGLAEMYVADERFRAHYEDVAPGLAQYVRDAIVANADRQG
jgi:DNA-binding transcriptional MerR regulator